jgi:hypothetical protein
MRYSGLRIGDASSAEVASLQDRKLGRHTQKTGSHVYLEIPPAVVRALDEIPKASERFWFWSGNGLVETASKDWQAPLAEIFEEAEILDGPLAPFPSHVRQGPFEQRDFDGGPFKALGPREHQGDGEVLREVVQGPAGEGQRGDAADVD